LKKWAKNDPVDRCREQLLSLGEWSAERDEQLRNDLAAEIDASIREVQREPDGDPATLEDHAYA